MGLMMLERAGQSCKDLPWVDGSSWIEGLISSGWNGTMYPNKARIGSVFEPDKAPSVGLTLGLLDRSFDLRNSGVVSQFDENPGKAAFLDSNGRIRTNVVGFGYDG
ncbi:hypothetical protein Bca52824_039110 [Brassica carinata]|uniref:Uncharacterized protein n=1 Tax=Brassica carinata TaxID=52824 RepID=A0A8X7UWL2_BRACI|nr:hypothetical protein Bca52824_039110 [Brassica carinata]